MKTTYHTDEYEFSHGKKPRGGGYWAFEAVFYGEQLAGYFEEKRQVWVSACTFTLAKKFAKQKAVAMIPEGTKVDELILSVQP